MIEGTLCRVMVRQNFLLVFHLGILKPGREGDFVVSVLVFQCVFSKFETHYLLYNLYDIILQDSVGLFGTISK